MRVPSCRGKTEAKPRLLNATTALRQQGRHLSLKGGRSLCYVSTFASTLRSACPCSGARQTCCAVLLPEVEQLTTLRWCEAHRKLRVAYTRQTFCKRSTASGRQEPKSPLPFRELPSASTIVLSVPFLTNPGHFRYKSELRTVL